MYITNRERSIVELLLKSQHLFVSLEALAKELEVSKRSIQRDIQQLEKTLQEFDMELVKRPNEGVRIQGHRQSFESLRNAMGSVKEMEMQREERALIIFYELIQAAAPIKATALSVELGISNTTLLQDIDYLGTQIKGTHLELLRKRGYGVELLGKEKDKRWAFINLVMGRLEQIAIFSVKKGEFLSFDTRERIYRIIEPKTLNMLEKLILNHMMALPYKLTDLALLELLLHVHLALERMQRGDFVEALSTEVDNPQEDAVAHSIFKELTERLHVLVPETEVRYLSSIISSAKRMRDEEQEGDAKLKTLAGQLIEEVSRATGYYFNKDKRFIDALVSHLEPLFNRIQQGVIVANPIKAEIKQDYGVLYNALEYILREKFPNMEFNDDEVGFLTLHFASAIKEFKEVPKVTTLVVCTSGIATSRMLTKRLLDKFPQLTIIEQGSIRALQKLDLGEFDLIISTVGIHGADFEYIQVNPMLSKEDEAVLERVINGKLLGASKNRQRFHEGWSEENGGTAMLEEMSLLEDAGRVIKEVLEDFRVFNVEVGGLETLLKDIAKEIETMECPASKESLVQIFLEKEERAGSGLPDSTIALLHGRWTYATRIYYRLYKVREPMGIRGMDGNWMDADTFIFLLTPETMSDTALEMVSTLSVSLLEEQIRERYVRGDREDVLRLLELKFKSAYMDILQRMWKT